jgi:class 3 adenylate cyclase
VPLDLRSLGLSQLLELRERLSRALVRRFERTMAMVFTDIVGSTTYFAQFGDEAGHALQRRHLDMLASILPEHGGRVVDTAGDGAFTCFPEAESALAAMLEVLRRIEVQDRSRPPEHHLTLRIGIHVGSVLTDGVTVAGDAVNLAARVTATGRPNEIRLTRAAAAQLGEARRDRLRPVGPTALKGFARPVDLMSYEWGDETVPNLVLIEETAERHPLPDKPTITFGRLRELEGKPANDVVIELPERAQQLHISRWHFELRRERTGMFLYSLSDQATEVDGAPVAKGDTVQVRAGTVVRLGGGAATLHLLLENDAAAAG